MIGQTLEATIVISMIVLIAYPSVFALRQALRERRGRRIRIVARDVARRTRDV